MSNNSEKIVESIDCAINLLNDLKDNLKNSNPDLISVEIGSKRDLKPYYELCATQPSGFEQKGADITSIVISDGNNIGKILK